MQEREEMYAKVILFKKIDDILDRYQNLSSPVSPESPIFGFFGSQYVRWHPVKT